MTNVADDNGMNGVEAGRARSTSIDEGLYSRYLVLPSTPLIGGTATILIVILCCFLSCYW